LEAQRRRRLAARRSPARTITLTTAPAATGRTSSDRPAAARSDEFVAEDVSFRNGDRTVEGTVFTPAGQATGRPGIVLVPGSGEGVPREIYQPHAEAFARAGTVALAYDKRTAADGYSLFEASITDLADDAIAAVRLCGTDPMSILTLWGVHGHSEGGWTVAVAGVRSPDVSFVVASAASALPPEQTQVWMNRTQLRHAGVGESLLRPLGENLTRHVVGAGKFRLAGHDAYTLRVIDGAHHLMGPSRDGFDVDFSSLGPHADLAPGYVDTVTAWVNGLADGPPDASADAPPPQGHNSAPLTPLDAYESLGVQLATLGLLLVGLGAYPLTAVIRRLRRRRDPLPTRWPARALVVAGLAIPLLTIGYLGFIMVTGALAPGPVVVGRPLWWLVLQLATLGAAAATGLPDQVVLLGAVQQDHVLHDLSSLPAPLWWL
jgi:hypothetical protein